MKKIFDYIKNIEFIRNSRLLAPFSFLVYYPVKKNFAFEAIDTFVGKDLPANKRNSLARKIIWNRIVYHFAFSEYFTFGVENLSRRGKLAFIGDGDHEAWADKMNRKENETIFMNKYETYKRFKEFYRRDVCLVTDDEESRKEFSGFLNTHPKFIAKPIDGSLGMGIAVFDSAEYPSEEILFCELLKQYGKSCLVEELIVQTDEIAALNPTSVNTLRITTFRFDDRVEIRYPRMRIGQHGSIVDNAGAGGILAMVDYETGVIYTAADKHGNSYITHPDTGVQIIGYKVPHWEDVKAFARQLAQVVPDNRYTGWDIAVTAKGCVMIEGNSHAEFGQQIALGKGFKDELESIISEMKCGQ